jgi:anti-sigma factor RsiW
MNKIQETNPCGHAEQLVNYLYGESGATERAGFEQHLAACAACRDELRAFGQVREAVGAWRAELLTSVPAFAHAGLSTTEVAVSPADAARRNIVGMRSPRSAWGALREFFTLSPAWLRFGAVAASLVVSALAALAVANAEVGRENGRLVFRTGVWRTPAPTAPQPQTASVDSVDGARLNQLVAERDAAVRQLEEARAQLDDSRAANIQAVYDVIDDSSQADSSSESQSKDAGVSRQRRTGGSSAARKSARRGARNEEDLPRLLDLLGSGN